MVGESSCGVAGRVVDCDFLNIEVNLLPDDGVVVVLLRGWLALF